MDDTTRNWLMESNEARRLKEVFTKTRHATVMGAISERPKELGNLGQWLTVMVWAEHQMDAALEQASPWQCAQLHRAITDL